MSESSRALTAADGTDLYELRILARLTRAVIVRKDAQFDDAIRNLREAGDIAEAKGAVAYVDQIDARLAELVTEPALA
jgi:hypothetical protein